MYGNAIIFGSRVVRALEILLKLRDLEIEYVVEEVNTVSMAEADKKDRTRWWLLFAPCATVYEGFQRESCTPRTSTDLPTQKYPEDRSESAADRRARLPSTMSCLTNLPDWLPAFRRTTMSEWVCVSTLWLVLNSSPRIIHGTKSNTSMGGTDV